MVTVCFFLVVMVARLTVKLNSNINLGDFDILLALKVPQESSGSCLFFLSIKRAGLRPDEHTLSWLLSPGVQTYSAYNMWLGLTLALLSAFLIGGSVILKKKALLRLAGNGQTRAGERRRMFVMGFQQVMAEINSPLKMMWDKWTVTSGVRKQLSDRHTFVRCIWRSWKKWSRDGSSDGIQPDKWKHCDADVESR